MSDIPSVASFLAWYNHFKHEYMIQILSAKKFQVKLKATIQSSGRLGFTDETSTSRRAPCSTRWGMTTAPARLFSTLPVLLRSTACLAVMHTNYAKERRQGMRKKIKIEN